jgi:hypothetical protein
MPGKSSRSRRAISVVIVGVVAAVVLYSYPWPRKWQIAAAGGLKPCVVSRGQSLSQVATECGAPTSSGSQPKIAEGWMTFCSAPCELRGQHLIFYGCETTVARVEAVTADYQGCLLQ